MRLQVALGTLAACLLSLNLGYAQDMRLLWIRSVTVDAVEHTLTIAGSGFSDTCEVTLDGQPVTARPGGSATQIVVAVPAAILAATGTYRMTVVDPVSRLADVFEVMVPGPVEMTTALPTAPETGHARPAGALDPAVRQPLFAIGAA